MSKMQPSRRSGSDDSQVLFNDPSENKKNPKIFPERYSFFFIIGVTILLAISITFIVLYLNTVSKLKYEDNTISANSVTVAAGIISGMDTTVDPCKDFYRYACGGEIKKTIIPQGLDSKGQFQKLKVKNEMVLNDILRKLKESNNTSPLLKKASIVYEACMDPYMILEIGNAPLKEVIKSLGSWPVTDPDFKSDNWDLIKALVAYKKTIDASLLFGISVTSDAKNASKNAITFSIREINKLHKERKFVEDDFAYYTEKMDYSNLTAMAIQMGANTSMLHYLDQAIEFNYKLYRTMYSYPRMTFEGLFTSYERMTLKEFANKTEIPLEWLLTFLNTLFEETGYKIQETEMVVSYNAEYIKKAYKMFTELTPEVQASYVILQAVYRLRNYLEYEESSSYYRWEVCTAITSQIYQEVLAKPFVERVFDTSKSKKAILEMVHNIKKVFVENMYTLSWLDEKTRKYAIEKVFKMKEHIAYPDEIFNDTALELLYKDFDPKPDEYFRNIVKAKQFSSKLKLSKIGKPVDDMWSSDLFMVNAMYSPFHNRIAIPVGILQSVFYGKTAPMFINYGAVGWIIGHEITHGFDTNGKKFTYNGNYESWWSKNASKKFDQKSKCFVKQYNNMTFYNSPVNGTLTLAENIADNGGVRQSLQAYKEWVTVHGEEEKLPGLDLTPDQLFFVAYGQTLCTASTKDFKYILSYDVHSPPRVRINGALKNLNEFSQAFKCPIGSFMNPSTKCRLW